VTMKEADQKEEKETKVKEEEIIPRNYKNPVSLLTPVANRTPYWGSVLEPGVASNSAKSKKRKQIKEIIAQSSNPFLAPSLPAKNSDAVPTPNPYARSARRMSSDTVESNSISQTESRSKKKKTTDSGLRIDPIPEGEEEGEDDVARRLSYS